VFVVGGVHIPATLDHVVDTFLATTLGKNGARVALVEHVCAALHAAGIDNVELHVEGEEIPVLDGSSRVWGDALLAAGVVAQGAPRREVRVEAPVEVVADGAWARFEPADTFELDLHVDYAHPAIGEQRYAGPATGASFFTELAWARTFGFLADAERLRAAGIARGASLENTVVYDGAGVLNPDGLRAPDEVVVRAGVVVAERHEVEPARLREGRHFVEAGSRVATLERVHVQIARVPARRGVERR
jgi:UDP-3-O-[3-hydroxymyristoyl] N-acetylglucosamine deacetylase